MTHVFVVDQNTFKVHLEYMFAGTGANNKQSTFLTNPTIPFPSTTERMLVGMIADISRIRINDKVIFYVQATNNNPGTFFGIFKVVSEPFFDENDQNNYLLQKTNKGLSFRVLLEPDEVFFNGLTEHEYLDSLAGKDKPYDLCWSLIYRKLKGNRGCTMITDYEFDDFLKKLKIKNNNISLSGNAFTYDERKNIIVSSNTTFKYEGRMTKIDILPRLIFKATRANAFEVHLQAYLTKNIDSDNLAELLLPFPKQKCWLGNEVSCGVGMQRIDLMIKQETEKEVVIRVIELKDEAPYEHIVTNQLPWYLEWLSYYVTPKYLNKIVNIIPTVIAKGSLPQTLLPSYQKFNFPIKNVIVEPLQYIGFQISNNSISFKRYL